jgi:replicative DNA helicase
MIEHQLIKLILNKEAYLSLKPYIYDKILPSELRAIYHTIKLAHEKYEHDLTLEEVKLLHFSHNTFSTAQKNVIGIILDKVEDADLPHEDVIRDVAIRLSKQTVCQEALELLSPIVLGNEDDLTPVVNLLQQYQFDDTVDNIHEISTDIADIVELSMPKNRYKFALQPLQEKVLGAGPGNLVVVFGRPEMGKSSFVASNNIGYLNQGLKVSYFGNEEPGWKIMMNHIRSATGLTDAELQHNMEAGIAHYDEWDSIKSSFKLHDGVGMAISDLDNYIQKHEPNVVVIDQLDKVMLPTSYSKEHSRLKAVYVQARELAKKHGVLVIGVSQASADADNRRYIHFSMLDESKTGKAGEADVIIGIGQNDIDPPEVRHLNISKNKISGNLGHFSCLFQTDICRVIP